MTQSITITKDEIQACLINQLVERREMEPADIDINEHFDNYDLD